VRRAGRGVVAAAKKVNLSVPLVVRLEGTNVEEGRKILNESSLSFEVAGSMTEAAEDRPGGGRCGMSILVTKTPGSWCRASPAARACSTPSR
jgi:succinyl-CoA synthetase beta subunit